ncbi:MAG: hypothetical protein KDA72_01210 [Planctomycetales bacterium]|nr:hypothetical protein [Planctomycetales bacterium]
MTNDIPPESMDEIIKLIGDGQKLDAVKRYKDLRRTSLLEAKNFIEELTVRLEQESPEILTAPPELEGITELIYAGQKLEAVKRYRDQRSISLVDAKQFVEQLTDELKQKYPDRFSARSTTGCAGLIALIAIALVATTAGLMVIFDLTL